MKCVSRLPLLATIASAFLSCESTTGAQAQNYQEGVVETRILDKDPQAGVKSLHFYFIDFDKKIVSGSFSTGTTKINLGVIEFDVASVRNNFKITGVSFGRDHAKFTMRGTTASGVRIMPDIDYEFHFNVSRSGAVSIRGCHDGYPAYLIQHNGKELYRFEHDNLNLINLLGTCDRKVVVN